MDSKILLRTWVPGEGCVHLRAPAMEEDEARALLRLIRSLTSIDWDLSTEVTRLDLEPVGLSGVAFVMPSPVPDPDHPQRSSPRLCVLYLPDPDGYLAHIVSCQLREIEWPTTREDLDLVQWIPFDPSEGSTGVQVRPMTLPARNLPTKDRRFVVLGVMLAVLAFRLLYWSRMPRGGVQVSGPSHTSDTDASQPGRVADEWSKTKGIIQDILKDKWAAQIREGEEVPTGDADLLRAFAALFQRPSLEGIQEKDALDELLTSKEQSEVNPFTSFLYRLPEQIPKVTDPDHGTDWQESGQKYLSELAQMLERGGISIKAGNKIDPESVRSALVYNDYYKAKWKPKHPDWEDGAYCSGGEQYFKWLAEVRNLLKKRYTSPPMSP